MSRRGRAACQVRCDSCSRKRSTVMSTQPVHEDVTLEVFTTRSPLFPEVAGLFCATWPDRFFSASDASARIQQHARYNDFRGVAAIAAGHVVGFVYGYTNEPGQWWYDQIVEHVHRRGLKLDLRNSFAFTELAVAAKWRQHGIGQLLHDAALHDLPHHYAILSTQTYNEAALALYQRNNWETLIPQMRFDGSAPDFVILGKALI